MGLAWLGLLLAGQIGCILDRTGQSASEAMRREMALQTIKVSNLEGQFDQLDLRVAQLEELTRARGQEEIRSMENLEQFRTEVARMRGEIETLRYDFDESANSSSSVFDDARFRLEWLELRADSVEEALGVDAAPPPKREGEDGEAEAGAEGETGETGESGESGESGEPDESTASDETAEGTDEGEGAAEKEAKGADELIALAENHLAEGRARAAEVVLNRFVETYPDHERVPEALYRRAESRFNDGDYSTAVLKFQEVIDQYKTSPWAPWAMLRQGEAFEAQGQVGNAQLFYEDVIRMWPKSKAAKEARQKL